MANIKEFKQLHMVETYGKKYYIIESDKIELLDKLIETDKFVKVSGARINVTNISTYYPIPNNPVYSLVVALPESIRGDALYIVNKYEKDNESMLTEYSLLKAIRKKFKIPLPKNWSPTKYTRQGIPDKEYIDVMRKIVCEYLYLNYPNNA